MPFFTCSTAKQSLTVPQLAEIIPNLSEKTEFFVEKS